MGKIEYSEFKQFTRRMLIENAILLFIGILFLIIFQRFDMILGWLWGSISNIAYFIMLYRNLMKLPNIDEAQRNAFVNKVVGRRFLIICILIIIAAVVPQIHLLAATAGIISFKLLIYIDQLVVKPFILPRLSRKTL